MTITKAHITRRASDDEVPAKTVERDYVLAHAIAAIAAYDSEGKLIFKGGTSLRFLHFEDFRYSADLDFTITDATKMEAVALVNNAFRQRRDEPGPQLWVNDAEPPRIAYLGPLGRERTIKLDLADDEHVLHTERRSLLPLWPDVPVSDVLAYTPLEVAGEKLRCILQRLQCRDLFDLDVLFSDAEVDVVEAASLFQIKAKHRGIDPSSFAAKYGERLGQYQKRWQNELSEHVLGDVPHFEQIKRRMGRFLRGAGLL